MIRIFLLFLLFFSANSYGSSSSKFRESLKCSTLFSYFERKYDIPADTLHAISLKESGIFHEQSNIPIVWPWSVNIEGKGYSFGTKKQAVLFVKKQILSGKKSIDVGCMQINLYHHNEAFDSIEEAFDPKSNVNYGAYFLKSNYEKLGSWPAAVARYHSASPIGDKYKKDVIKIAREMPRYKHKLRSCVKNLNKVMAKNENVSFKKSVLKMQY